MPTRKQQDPNQRINLKALLAAAPLDGIELDRGRDVGRDVASLGAKLLNPSRKDEDDATGN